MLLQAQITCLHWFPNLSVLIVRENNSTALAPGTREQVPALQTSLTTSRAWAAVHGGIIHAFGLLRMPPSWPKGMMNVVR